MVKTVLTLGAIVFRTLDILESDADPETMMKKQEKLKGHVSSFTQDATTRAAGSMKDKASSANKNRMKKKAERQAILDGKDPSTGAPIDQTRKDQLTANYEAKYGTNPEVDAGQVTGERAEELKSRAASRKREEEDTRGWKRKFTDVLIVV